MGVFGDGLDHYPMHQDNDPSREAYYNQQQLYAMIQLQNQGIDPRNSQPDARPQPANKNLISQQIQGQVNNQMFKYIQDQIGGASSDVLTNAGGAVQQAAGAAGETGGLAAEATALGESLAEAGALLL